MECIESENSLTHAVIASGKGSEAALNLHHTSFLSSEILDRSFSFPTGGDDPELNCIRLLIF